MSRFVPLTAESLDWVQQIGATEAEILDYFRAIIDYLHGSDPQPKERVVKGILSDQLRRWNDYTEKVEAKQRAQSQAASKTNAKRWATAEGMSQPPAAPPSVPEPPSQTAPPAAQPLPNPQPPANSPFTRLLALYERWATDEDGKNNAWHDRDPAAAQIMFAVKTATDRDRRADLKRKMLENNPQHMKQIGTWQEWQLFWAFAQAIATTPAAPREALAKVFDAAPTAATAATLTGKIKAIQGGGIHAPAAYILSQK